MGCIECEFSGVIRWTEEWTELVWRDEYGGELVPRSRVIEIDCPNCFETEGAEVPKRRMVEFPYDGRRFCLPAVGGFCDGDLLVVILGVSDLDLDIMAIPSRYLGFPCISDAAAEDAVRKLADTGSPAPLVVGQYIDGPASEWERVDQSGADSGGPDSEQPEPFDDESIPF